MQGKTVVITGANSGIGEAAARELASRGATLALACRNLDKGEAAKARIQSHAPHADLHLHHLDLASFASVRAAAASLLERHPRVDVLVNNAGLFLPKRQETEDGLEATLQINHFGPFLLTSLLAERILASAPARIINVSSDAHRGGKLRFEDLEGRKRYEGFDAYAASKLMNILHVRALAKRLDPTRVTANALHPGVVATGFAQDEKSVFGRLVKLFAPLLASPEQGADTTIHLAAEPEGAETSGKYFVRRREKTPSAAARDDEAAERLWAESERITNAPAFPSTR
jgi:NAD(P)-dependent dehydrogenase (short-subunit alcohol dehydrogenase family)